MSIQTTSIIGNTLARIPAIDVHTRALPELWEGAAGRVRFSVFAGESIIASPGAQWASFSCELKTTARGQAPLPATPPLALSIVAAAAFGAPSAGTWADGSSQHALFAFSGPQLALRGKYWIVIYGLTVGGDITTLAAGIIQFRADGGPSTALPDPVVEGAYTEAETLALLAALETRAEADATAAAADAQQAAILAAATDATTKANAAQAGAISSAASDATTKSNAAQAAAIASAASDATSKSNAAQAAAIASAASDATSKANAAQAAAISSAASDATSKANAAQAAAIAASVPTTRTLTAAGLVTGGGNLTTDRTITVTEAADATVLNETVSTTAVTPRRWWQRLAFWLSDTTAKTIAGPITLLSNLTVNGSDIRVPSGGLAFVDGASVATRDRADARYAGLVLMAQQLQFGKFNPIAVSSATFTLIGSVASTPGISWQYDPASINTGSAILREVGRIGGMCFAAFGNSSWQFSVPQQVSVSLWTQTIGVSSGADGIVSRFSVALGSGDTGDLSARGYGVRITRSGASLLVVGQCHNGTTLTTTGTLATVADPDNSNYCLSYDGAGTLTIFRNGVSIGTCAGGPGGPVDNAGPRCGVRTPGGGVGTMFFRMGPTLTITDMRP